MSIEEQKYIVVMVFLVCTRNLTQMIRMFLLFLWFFCNSVNNTLYYYGNVLALKYYRTVILHLNLSMIKELQFEINLEIVQILLDSVPKGSVSICWSGKSSKSKSI